MNANETNSGLSEATKYVCVCWCGVAEGIIRVSTFFNSYRLYVPFVLLIGGSVKRAVWESGREEGGKGKI